MFSSAGRLMACGFALGPHRAGHNAMSELGSQRIIEERLMLQHAQRCVRRIGTHQPSATARASSR
jgi:hypothetical protein